MTFSHSRTHPESISVDFHDPRNCPRVGKEIMTQYLQEEIFAWENIAKKTSLKHAELLLAEISPHPPKKIATSRMSSHFNVVVLGIILEEEKSIMVGLWQVVETCSSRYKSQKIMTYNFSLLILDLGVSQTRQICFFLSLYFFFLGGGGEDFQIWLAPIFFR